MIKAYCKRVLLFLPYLACYFLALGIAMLALVVYASEFLFEDNTDSIVSVACYMPDDDAYNRLGLGLITRMESVKHTVDINMVKSKKQVLSQVESGDAIAGIIISFSIVPAVIIGLSLLTFRRYPLRRSDIDHADAEPHPTSGPTTTSNDQETR